MARPKSKKKLQQQRQEELHDWFQQILPDLNEKIELEGEVDIHPLTGDASFRRYFLGLPEEHNYVLVDAPPDKEDSRSFVHLAEQFRAAGINVPKVYGVDYERGFLCLSYLGDTLLWEKLQDLKKENRLAEVNAIYNHAFDILLKIQSIREGSDIMLPPYDRNMLFDEVQLFSEWFCHGIMGLALSDEDNALLDYYYERLLDSALAQKQVCVHRDYHSRNLIYQPDGNFGVLDFQDAVIGPFTYDLVSLLKDCYINWPHTMIREWALQYANLAQTRGIIEGFEEKEFLRSFDMMGIQRHMKAVGIFSRLYLRDGKRGYLADIPRTLAYVKEVVADYPDMHDLAWWLQKKIYPMLVTRLNAILNRDHIL